MIVKEKISSGAWDRFRLVSQTMSWNWISKLEQLREEGEPLACVTVTQCLGSTPRETGAKMLVLPDGGFFGTIGGGHLESLAIQDAQHCMKENRAKVIKYPLGAKAGQCCGGSVELLFEVINTGPHLYLFGAGHVGQAVCRTLMGTPFLVHVVDSREEWIGSPELPKAVKLYPGEWEDFLSEAKWSAEKTFVAIMTHRHDMDQAIVEAVVRRPTKYIGLIGSQAKWGRFSQRLRMRGFSEEELTRVKCPLGIPIHGGKTPQEIAISFAAEILKIHYDS